jgi:hypothetical protein
MQPDQLLTTVNWLHQATISVLWSLAWLAPDLGGHGGRGPLAEPRLPGLSLGGDLAAVRRAGGGAGGGVAARPAPAPRPRVSLDSYVGSGRRAPLAQLAEGDGGLDVEGGGARSEGPEPGRGGRGPRDAAGRRGGQVALSPGETTERELSTRGRALDRDGTTNIKCTVGSFSISW